MEKVLKELGFSEREIKVYLALLELNSTTVGPIASKTRIQHSKVYQTLEKLRDKGLASYIIKSRTKYFQAENPKRILAALKEKERDFLEILPQLEQKQMHAKQPQTAKVYEGYKAIKSMFESIIEETGSKSYYYVFAFKDEYLNSPLASRFLRQVHMQLAEKKIDDRLIVNSAIRREFKKNYAEIKNMKCRFTHLNLPRGLMIINDKVINWMWNERPTAIEITSKQIALQYKTFFLEIWNASKSNPHTSS